MPSENPLTVITEINKHILDIDLKTLLIKAERKITILRSQNPVNLLNADIEYLENLRKYCILYCNNRKIDFNKSVAIVIKSKDKGDYVYFLAQMLIVQELHDTKAFLNHHLKSFPKRVKPIFMNWLIYDVKQIIEANTTFDNRMLLERIMVWYHSKIAGLNINQNAPTLKLVVTEKKNANKFIKLLSRQLYLKKYTTRESDFFCVISDAKKTDWKGSVELFVYLIKCLHNNSYNYITTSEGKNKIWTATVMYFKFKNSARENITSSYLANVYNNVTKRNPNKYAGMRSKVDEMLRLIPLQVGWNTQ